MAERQRHLRLLLPSGEEEDLEVGVHHEPPGPPGSWGQPQKLGSRRGEADRLELPVPVPEVHDPQEAEPVEDPIGEVEGQPLQRDHELLVVEVFGPAAPELGVDPPLAEPQGEEAAAARKKGRAEIHFPAGNRTRRSREISRRAAWWGSPAVPAALYLQEPGAAPR